MKTGINRSIFLVAVIFFFLPFLFNTVFSQGNSGGNSNSNNNANGNALKWEERLM